MASPEHIPYFIQVRGCINCSASKKMKEKHGKDYGFDHEIMAACLIRDCQSRGYTIMKPFIDPKEIVRLVKENPSPKFANNAKQILQDYEENFGEYFKAIGVNMQDFVKELS